MNSTVQDVCIKEEMGYEAVMGILDRHIQGEVDWNQFVRLDVLGVDVGRPNRCFAVGRFLDLRCQSRLCDVGWSRIFNDKGLRWT